MDSRGVNAWGCVELLVYTFVVFHVAASLRGMKVWSSSSENKGVRENGLEVPITNDLFDALRRLRRRRNPRAIWAGAICINQRDEKE